jgi:UDP-4-amino-4,6-dideoxy-N-acetyl-beta-L-altrosamine transaminase
MIPYGRQNISEEDIDAVIRILRSEYLTQGPEVPQFEEDMANYCSVEFAVASNSATSSLHLACLALGVGPGDYVWTSSITFVASANCARFCGAEVDLVDINPKTFNMCVENLEERLLIANRNGKLPKVIIPVHMAGQACEMEKIKLLADNYGVKVIEDASHAIGGSYKGLHIGSCKYSDITVFSFHPVKIITSGEGGIAVTNNQELAAKMALLRSHGITRDPASMRNPHAGPWYYEQLELGFNYRLTDIAAALGRSQLKRIDNFVQQRHEIADRYDKLFADTDIKVPFRDPDAHSSFHLYVVQPDLRSLRTSQNELFDRLRSQGILANLHYIPIYRHPYYQNLGLSASEYPNSEAYYATAMTLPIYPGLKAEEQEYIMRTLVTPIGRQTLF